MNFKNLTGLACAGILVAAIATPALSQSMMKMGDEAITARQDLMKSNGGTLKAAGTASGADAVAAGEKLVANFAALKDLWPADSMEGDTRAKPEIWNADGSVSDAFNAELTKAMAAADAVLVAANSGDADAYGASLKAMGGTCFSCHSQFQVKRN